MPTHRQQSFIATLWFGNQPVNTLGTLLGKPAWVNWLGVPLTAPHFVGTIRDDSAMLSCQPGNTDRAILLYFRHTDEGYSLYVREPGDYFGKAVVTQDGGYLGLMPPADHRPSPFTLLKPDGNPAHYADLASDINVIGLAMDGQHVSRSYRPNSSFEYLAARDKTVKLWVLKILKRNVPWLSSPNEV